MFDNELYWKKKCEKYCNPNTELARLFVEPKIEHIKKYIKIDKDATILDAGTATGIFAHYFLKYTKKVVGFDFSESLLKKNIDNHPLVCGDAFFLPFKDKAFDIVFASCLLHHIDNPENVLREFARVSRKYIILCEPNRDNFAMFLFSAIFRHERGGLKFNKLYIKKLISASCSKIISLNVMGFVTPNRMPLVIAKFLALFNQCNKIGFYIMAIGEI